MAGPGVSFQCHIKEGLHIWEDHYILEIIEPEGDNSVADGEDGEVVFTTLMREATPLIRYRTRDLASVIPEPCECGRTHRRISRIKGRIVKNDQLLIDVAESLGFELEASIRRQLQDTKKYFNPAIGKIREERIVILRHVGEQT